MRRGPSHPLEIDDDGDAIVQFEDAIYLYMICIMCGYECSCARVYSFVCTYPVICVLVLAHPHTDTQIHAKIPTHTNASLCVCARVSYVAIYVVRSEEADSELLGGG